ncbi:preprotein translocase subunit SecD [Bradyrhizobium sp. LM2.7]
MLYFTRWRALGIVLTALIVCLCAVPNFFPEAQVKTWPAWAQRRLVLGLDLQGGSYLLLEVDGNYVKKERLDQIRDEGRRVLRDNKIGFTGGLTVRNDAVEVRISKESDVPTALSKLRELAQPLGGLIGSSGQRDLDVTDAGGGLIRLSPPQAAMIERMRKTIEQSIQIVERRVNELGTVEPVIQRQGNDRILVQVPGLQDPTRLKELLGKTAKMEFRMVDTSVPPDQAQQGRLPPESELLMSASPPPTPYVVKKQVLVAGGDLTDAQASFDQRTNEPVVSFKFNTSGARKFSQATQENVGLPFAIVLDNKVISAPVIREPITGGQGQISGSFTVQSANDLAILLRAGALPAPLTVVEERTVGPGLGQDSIEKGELAAYVGSILVIIFMLLTYRLFGVFANIAVAINVAMIFGLLSLLNATLTLPGIAGIVLTVGIAVDSNVLIYERIREELRGGRNAISAIDAGFKRALATILDSNITTFIAAAVLFYIGTGPVRGFRRDARHRHHHHGVHRLHADPADRGRVGAVEAAAERADLGAKTVTHYVLIGLGILIAVLTVVAALGLLPSLRIVPDDTHFDFTRFRRISFPISAALSIVAITLFFTHGLNFGIDFRGGTLLEVQAKSGSADIAAMRTALDALRLGEVQLQQFGGPADVLIRVAEQPGAATPPSRRPCRRSAARSAIRSSIAASRWWAPVSPASCWPTACSA